VFTVGGRGGGAKKEKVDSNPFIMNILFNRFAEGEGGGEKTG